MADLLPYIYHEVQDHDGSMLCAQHCLNNLLQQRLYSEFDLADLATNLDAQENAELGPSDRRETSQNMDDTGFFSLSVLENALQVFDLTLVRWRGESMKGLIEHPENQTAFVLNLHSHWLPLRRFSTSSRWYNLNSFYPQPKWISPTYLQMVLAAAEEEGYSVFVVRKLSEVEGGGAGLEEEMQGLGLLPECEADMMALQMGDPAGRTGAGTEDMSNNATRNPPSGNDTYASAARSAQPQASGSRSAPVPALHASSSSPSFNEVDPVAASLARSKADLARFQQEQSSAYFESQAYNPPQPRRRRQGDVPDIFGEEAGIEADSQENGMEGAAQPRALNRFERQQQEEEEMMARAMEESLREARERGEVVDAEATSDDPAGTGRAQPSEQQRDNADGTPRSAPQSRPRSAPPHQPTTSIPIDLDDADEELDDDFNEHARPAEPVYDFMAQSRYYDDDDAALQAALSASLAEGVPEGWVPPPPKIAVPAASARSGSQQAPTPESIASAASPAVTSIGQQQQAPLTTQATDDGDEEEIVEDDEEDEDDEPAQAVLSPEELRRKRLERFK